MRRAQRKRHGRLLALPLIVVGVAVAAATGFILSVLWPGWPGTPVGPNAPALPVTVAGVGLQRAAGRHPGVDATPARRA